MCRHLAYLGPPRPLGPLLWDAPHALVRQAQAPRLQHDGATNLDGWGVGWWPADNAPPERRRTTTPMPDERDLVDPDRPVPAFVAAARLASPGSVIDVTGNAPFVEGPWLFSLNGFVAGFHDGVGAVLRGQVSPERRAALLGDTDSEVLFALVLDLVDGGAAPGTALASVTERALALSHGRLNLLLGDGRRLWATAWRHSLFTLTERGLAAGGVVVASEPLDDDPAWRRVGDGSLVATDGTDLQITPLAGAEGVA